MKTSLLPLFASIQTKKIYTNWCSKLKVTFAYSTYAAKLHSFGDKDLKILFPFVVLRRDNVKTKDSLQTLIFEDLSWEIVLYCNRAIMSQYFFFKCSKILHTEILNFQCPGVTRITISTRISQDMDLVALL